MRLIPGKTKVQIELFKGVSLWDVLIGGVAVAMLLLVLLSSLPFKLAICIAIFVIAAMLLVRLDTEPNYIMLLNIIKHLAYSRRFEKVYDDEMILKKSDGTAREEFLENYKSKNEERNAALTGQDGAEPVDGTPDAEAGADGTGQTDDLDVVDLDAADADVVEPGDPDMADADAVEPGMADVDAGSDGAEQVVEEVLSEKELIKRENKILKSKTATEEEKDAVWLARAQRSAAKKEAKRAKKQGKPLVKAAGASKPAATKSETPKQSAAEKAAAPKTGAQPQKAKQAAQKAGAQAKKPGSKKQTAQKPDPGVKLDRKLDKKEQKRLEKELIKEEDKILKSKTATEEEKDAVWLARAQRSAAKKEAKKQEKLEQAENADYAFMENAMAFSGIKDDLIEYGGKYYGTVIEIDPVEFRFFSNHRRNNSIEMGAGRVLRSIHIGFAANIVKLERPIIYDKYLAKEEDKLAQIRKSYESGMMSEEELQARVDIENDRLAELRHLCTDKQVVAPFYYICLFENDKKQLELQTKAAIDSLEKGEMTVRRLDSKELAVFLKYTNQLDFNERDIEKYQPEDYAQWAMPQRVSVKYRTVEVNDIVTHNFRVVKYPSWVGDAWLAGVMSLPATKVVVKCSPMDRGKAIRTIDRSLQELRGQFNATGVDSKRIELQGHIDTLSNLLATLQGEGEELLECNIYVTAYDVQSTRLQKGLDELDTLLPEISGMKKTVRRTWQENNFRLNDHFFNQWNAFVGSQVSAYDPEAKNGRGIPSNSLAACYPWIYAHISDEGGFKLGSSKGVPVFIDFFRRDSERVNSNMVIIGKSGSGKSYATKSILSNLASEDAKIFILDPENEYSELAQNLHGKVINVANAQYGRLNPFHIITALDDDEEGGGAAGSFATHLQFLEEFYRQILPDIEKDALEYLNNLTERLYTNKGITPETDLSKLRPEDYPVFDDLYDAVLEEFERTDNEYIRSMLRVLVNYVAKFSTGGRNSNIWNGPSTVTTDENFTVFNFQAMLSNRNTTIANAQMLLVLKYIDNEIIKNRDYNSKYGLKRKVVVVIDEAHVFIDAKFPIALDFMFQLAKRIRKYNGMQIVITQNIKDFVGSEEIARKSTAIINACQYSFIFALAPNDMHDLCTLYEKAGGISETEQEQIIQAPRGQAFTVMSATSRSTFRVEVPKNMVDMFQDRDFQSRYYTGTEGAAAWEDFVAGSRAAHDTNSKANKKTQIIDLEDAKQKNWVRFEEVTEEQAAEGRKAHKKKSLNELSELNKAEELGKKMWDSMSMDDAGADAEIDADIDTDTDIGIDTDIDIDSDMSDEDLDALIAQRRAEREAAQKKAAEKAPEKKPAEAPVQAVGTQEPAFEESMQTMRQLGTVLGELVKTMQQTQTPGQRAPYFGQSVAERARLDEQDVEQGAEQRTPSGEQSLDQEALVEEIRKKVLAEIVGSLKAEGVLPEDIDVIDPDAEPDEYGSDEYESEGYGSDEYEPDEYGSDEYGPDAEYDGEEYDNGEYDADNDDGEYDADEGKGGFDAMAMLLGRAKDLVEQERGQEAEESAEVVEPAEPDYDDYAAPGEVAGISMEDVAVLVAIARRHRAGM